jgi:YD repeat-containing protein
VQPVARLAVNVLSRATLGLLYLVGTASILKAVPPSWEFSVPHTGRVLYEGGWYQEFNLGVINGSPEFQFPLQLVYLSTRETIGIFGPQWFCPQLESAVIPQGVGGFYWQTLAGNVVLFRRSNRDDSSIYSDSSGTWLAKATSDHQEIRNQDGWKFSYERGHLMSLTSPTGRVLQFVWNGSDFSGIQIVDPVSGQQRVLLQATYSTDPHGISDLAYNGIDQRFTLQDNRDGRLSSWTSPTRDVFYFGYSSYGILNQIQHNRDPIQNFTSWLKDLNLDSSDQKNDPANWYLIQDPDNKYSFNSSGKKEAVLSPNKIIAVSNTGVALTSDYNPQGGVVVESNGKGNSRTTTYYRAPGQSFDGKVKSVEENGLVKAEYTYDPKTGLLTSITDNNGLTTYFEYPTDWKKNFKNPWDPKPIRVWRGSKDKPEVLAQYSYDDLGRVISTQDAAGQVTNFGYTPRGELGSATAPDGITSSLGYDAFGRCVQATTGDQTEAVEYDDQGHVKSRTAPDGSKTEFTYDELGNVTQVTRNGVPVMNYIRDASGKITGEKDSGGPLKRIDSDSHGNVLAEYAPDGSVTKYEYDQYNRRTAQIDGKGNKISFTFDPASHITKQTNALGNTTNWIYDDQGHLIEQDNGVQKIKYAYDDNNRLVTTDYGSTDQTINTTYDDHGRVTSMVTPATAFYYVYDKLGRTDAIRAICGQDEQVLRFRYNYYGQRTGLMLAQFIPAIAPMGEKIGYDARYAILQQTEYTYENRRLSSITSNRKSVVTYKYDAGGRPILKTYGNGIQASLSYDALGHLSRIIFAGGPIEVPLTLAYQWDGADQVIQRSWNGEVFHYDYDAGGRLTKVTQIIDDKTSQILEFYAYDKAGNIVEKTLQGEKTTLAYNAANELTSTSGPSGSVSYNYDATGRLSSTDGGPANTYGWLDKVIKTSQPNGNLVTLNYWPDGQLATEEPTSATAKTAVYPSSQPGSECFLWDGLALVRRDDTVYIVEPHPSGGVAIASHPIGRATEMTYYLNDLLGTTLAIIKNEGIEFNNLTSFGQLRRQAASVPQPTSIQAPTVNAPISSPQQQLPPSSH